MKVFRLELHCPDIQSQADAVSVHGALSSSPGFANAHVDVANHSVVLTTANQDKGRDVVQRLSKAGYPPDNEDLFFRVGERHPEPQP